MLKPGIVSATFRPLSVPDVIELAHRAGLSSVEWSSDVHVLPGFQEAALEARQRCQEKGLAVCGYASYYQLGKSQSPASDFLPVLKTAAALGAPVIRIWAGSKASACLTEEERLGLYEEARLLVSMAETEGVMISYEYHHHSLTDTVESAIKLLDAVPGSRTHWQTASDCTEEENQHAIAQLSSQITTVHVQNYKDHMYKPLENAKEEWMNYLSSVHKCKGEHDVCLEFVKDGSIAQFFSDSGALIQMVKEINGKV